MRSNLLSTSTLFNTTLFSPDTKYRIQQWDIPGISIDHQGQGTRVGNIFLQGDMLEYNPLDIKLIVDENLKLWKELVSVFQKYQIPGTNTCELAQGDSWVEVYDSKNKYLFKIYFHNCYIKSMGALNYMSNEDADIVTLDLSIVYDYYTIE
jgi:hypothetical protein